ncbi:sensor histidine kinase [Rheinheimera oceanensis]|uniref:sensor histidine kinase n=1 Tax=Rheinheimera oceanensis TaxID=2817449 RepID=UPI001BFEDB70|nr:PAS domain-containing protein [Rheinheimera oceanensis]
MDSTSAANTSAATARQGQQLLALQARILASPLLFSSDTNLAWQFLTKQISKALYADRVSIWLFSQSDVLQCIDLYQYKLNSHSSDVCLQRSNYPKYFSALQQHALIAASDAASHPAMAEFNDGYLQTAGIRSMLDAVIQSEQGLSGVICVEQVSSRRCWSVDEQHFIAAMASMASTVHTFSLHLQLQREYQLVLERQDMASRNARIGFWEASVSNGELWWSPMVYDIFGVDPQQFSPSVELFYQLVHPDDRAMVQQSELQAQLLGEQNVVHRIVLPDGSMRWVHEVAKWTSPQGSEPARLIGSVQDITQQQQTRCELQQFFSLSRDILCIANKQNYFERVNAAFSRITGYSETELLSRPYTDFIHPDDLISTDAEVNEQQQGRVTSGFCNRYRHKNGHYITLQWSSVLDPASDKLYASAQDITERLQLERIKNEFVSTVSHELRTPLTSINGALALVMSGCVGELPDQVAQLLQLANNNCQRLTSLINDLLDIEKLSAGMMQIVLQPQPVVALVRQSVVDNSPYGRDRNIQLQLQTGCDEQLLINVDSLRFSQVMANLLSNAIKFSPDAATVLVQIEQQHQHVRISVTDIGPGIADAFKAAIFQRFSQADSSDTRQKGGTGLGLALSKQLTESMHGSIGFSSSTGAGACFYVDFPLWSGKAAADA